MAGRSHQSPNAQRIPLLVITGPTATGKSALAIWLAERLDGEIVSADSAQIYRGLDIGTAKPTPRERAAVPHHLIDIRDPDETYNVAQFQADADACIADIHRRGRLPILVGGTGLYVRAVTARYRFEQAPGPTEQRAALYAWADIAGSPTLHRYLSVFAPEAAAGIHPNDTRRLVRAWEKVLAHSMPRHAKPPSPPSAQQDAADVRPAGEDPSPYHNYTVALTVERGALYRRINRRVDQQLALGWIEEARRLLMRWGEDVPIWNILGYRELKAYLNGEFSLDHAVAAIKRETRHFARRQFIWFRREAIDRWLDVTGGLPEERRAALLRHIADVLALPST